MGDVLPSRRRERRRIVCRSDGSMFDIGARHRVTPEELRDHLQDGGLFEAVTEATGRDCTLDVLSKVMLPAGLENATGVAGGLPGTNALGGLSRLDLITSLVGDSPWRNEDRERERPRRPRRRSGATEEFLAGVEDEPGDEGQGRS
jgi:hypothetical protein